MALYWIQLEEGFRDHAKVYALAERLAIPESQARGLMVGLWLWAVSNALDGDLTRFPAKAIAKAADYEGNASEFVQTLVDVHWLDQTETGLRLHGWEERIEPLVTALEYRRQQARDRQQKRRDRLRSSQSGHADVTPEKEEGHATVTRDDDVTDTTQERDVTRDCNACHAITEPNRTVPNIDDEDEVRARVREGFAEMYREVFGFEATAEEIRSCMIWQASGFSEELIVEALRRAAHTNANSPCAYAAECLQDWRAKGIMTHDQLIDHDFERDVKRGKIKALKPSRKNNDSIFDV